MDQSNKWRLNREDIKKWVRNLGIFLAPILVIYLAPVVDSLKDGFSFSDFAITPLVQGAIVLYIVNGILDLLRKFSAGAQPSN